MVEGGSLARTLSSLDQTIFGYFHLREFDDPSYDPRNNPPKNIFDRSLRLTKDGLRYTLTLANWLGKQMSEFKDNFLFEGDRSEYVTKKAGEIRQLLDQVEDVRVKLRLSNIPLIQKIFDSEISQKGIQKLLKGGYSLTDLVENCALYFFSSLEEFSPRGSFEEYCEFLRGNVHSYLNETIRKSFRQKADRKKRGPPKYIQVSHLDYPYSISWEEFKRKLGAGEYSLNHPHLALIFENFPPEQLTILNRRYGLDRRKPESVEELTNSLKKPLQKIERLEIQALTKLGIAIDPEGFRDYYYKEIGSKDLNRKNRIFYEYLKTHHLLKWKKYKDYDGNPYAYYLKNHQNITRGSLAIINSGLHAALKNRGQLHLVPRKIRDYQNNPYKIYFEKYQGTNRGRLARVDNPLYLALRRANQIELVPLRNQ